MQAFINPNNLYQNSSLLGIYVRDQNEALKIGAILNSSFAVLSRILFARVLGNEGNIQLDVYSAKMMLVPVLAANTAAQAKALGAFKRMIARPTLQFLSERRMRRMSYLKSGRERDLEELSDLSELDMADRRELDDAVLAMLGVENMKARNALSDRLYIYLREFFEDVRQKEELAIANKNRSKRRSTLSPSEIGNQVLGDIKSNHGHLLRHFRDFVNLDQPYITLDLPAVGEPEVHEDIFARDGSVRFLKGKRQISLVPTKNREQAALVASIALSGVRGLTRVPLDPNECSGLKDRYEKFIRDRDMRLSALVSERTADPDLQEEVVGALRALIDRSSP